MPEVEWKMIVITLMSARPGHTTATTKVTIILNVLTMMAVLIAIAKKDRFYCMKYTGGTPFRNTFSTNENFASGPLFATLQKKL